MHCAAQGSKEPELFGNSDNVEGERIDHSITLIEREGGAREGAASQGGPFAARRAGITTNRSARLQSRVPREHGGQLELLAGKLFGRMTDALAATGDEGRGKPR